MSEIRGLSVIETALDQWEWRIGLKQNGEMYVDSNLQYIIGKRETEFYKEHNVYGNAKVPFTTKEIIYEKQDSLEVYEAYLKNFSDVCFESLQRGKGLLIAGGFCSYLPGVVGGIQRAIGLKKALGIVWIDAHADIESPEETNSNLFAGIPLAVITGLSKHLNKLRKVSGIQKSINGKNILLSDYRAGSISDDINLKKAEVIVLEQSAFQDAARWKEAVNDLSQRVDAIFLHVDLDILDSAFVPAYKFKVAQKGETPENTIQNIHAVMQTGKVIAFSLMDVCFGDIEYGKQITYENAERILSAGLGAWKDIPDFWAEIGGEK